MNTNLRSMIDAALDGHYAEELHHEKLAYAQVDLSDYEDLVGVDKLAHALVHVADNLHDIGSHEEKLAELEAFSHIVRESGMGAYEEEPEYAPFDGVGAYRDEAEYDDTLYGARQRAMAKVAAAYGIPVAEMDKIAVSLSPTMALQRTANLAQRANKTGFLRRLSPNSRAVADTARTMPAELRTVSQHRAKIQELTSQYRNAKGPQRAELGERITAHRRYIEGAASGDVSRMRQAGVDLGATRRVSREPLSGSPAARAESSGTPALSRSPAPASQSAKPAQSPAPATQSAKPAQSPAPATQSAKPAQSPAPATQSGATSKSPSGTSGAAPSPSKAVSGGGEQGFMDKVKDHMGQEGLFGMNRAQTYGAGAGLAGLGVAGAAALSGGSEKRSSFNKLAEDRINPARIRAGRADAYSGHDIHAPGMSRSAHPYEPITIRAQRVRDRINADMRGHVNNVGGGYNLRRYLSSAE